MKKIHKVIKVVQNGKPYWLHEGSDSVLYEEGARFVAADDADTITGCWRCQRPGAYQAAAAALIAEWYDNTAGMCAAGYRPPPSSLLA